jgi:hypothetical protein
MQGAEAASWTRGALYPRLWSGNPRLRVHGSDSPVGIGGGGGSGVGFVSAGGGDGGGSVRSSAITPPLTTGSATAKQRFGFTTRNELGRALGLDRLVLLIPRARCALSLEGCVLGFVFGHRAATSIRRIAAVAASNAKPMRTSTMDR